MCLWSLLVEYLGLVIKAREVHMDPTKLAAVWDWAPPTSVKAVWSFIGFCNFYRKFIPNFSSLTWPLHDLTKKRVVFGWRPEQDKAFIKFKEIFLSAPIIHMPDISQPFHVMTYTSLTATGAVPFLFLDEHSSPKTMSSHLISWSSLSSFLIIPWLSTCWSVHIILYHKYYVVYTLWP